MFLVFPAKKQRYGLVVKNTVKEQKALFFNVYFFLYYCNVEVVNKVVIKSFFYFNYDLVLKQFKGQFELSVDFFKGNTTDYMEGVHGRNKSVSPRK